MQFLKGTEQMARIFCNTKIQQSHILWLKTHAYIWLNHRAIIILTIVSNQ